jgi:hypothetical protein
MTAPIEMDRKRKLRWISVVHGPQCEPHRIHHAPISENSECLRKFGDFLLAQIRCCWRQAFVTPLIRWTFLTRHTARYALARFLRGNEDGGLLVRIADSDRKTFSLIVLSSQSLAQSQLKENRHEAFDYFAIAAWRLRRPEHDESERRCLRGRHISGRLRRGGAP